MTKKFLASKSSSFFLSFVLIASFSGCGSSISDIGSIAMATGQPSTATVAWTGVLQKGVASRSITTYGVAIDAFANVYLTGSTDGNLETGFSSTGTSDLFLMKYNSAGTQKWIKQLGISGQSTTARGVALDSSGNPYVVGLASGNLVTGSGSSTGSSDLFLIKYDTSGVQQWIQQLGVASLNVQTLGIAIDSSNNIYVTGHTTGNLVTGSGSATGAIDYFLIKFNSSGSRQWTQQVGVATYQTRAYAVAVDTAGNIYLTGYTKANLEVGAGASTGTEDAYIAKYNSSGTRQWIKQRGVSAQISEAQSIAVSPSGNAYVIGQTRANLVTGIGASTGTWDGFVLKYDTSGNLLWATQLGVPTLGTFGWASVVDSSESIYLSGYTLGNLVAGVGAATGSQDYFLAKFNSSGTQQWLKQVGVSTTTTKAWNLKSDSAGNIMMVGETSANLVTLSGSSTGSQDLFALEYTSDGALK